MDVYLGLGSNLGNRLQNLRDGLGLLAPYAPVVAVSSLYESDPVGPGGQPPYLNAAARVDSALVPHALLDRLKRVEWLMGRRPSQRWGPRPLDMDILLAGERIVADGRLTIPHASLRERAFVLAPLAEIAGTIRVPGAGETVTALARHAGDAGLIRRAGPEWFALPYLA